ncbi:MULTISPECIES: hypothetical protein [unclassified Fibrobacter]|uniref:hypothetical protein n=1 Tax=unclassified Fibrobacter TaxID=2634177 RepID=UPI000920E4E6|nr:MULTISPECIES: hypothetical protein [unclassified Fibrobacter]MCQ2101557.1 hypothetical protein [Fibrobacter sp.]OWV16632.1 hypothetical protein B7992_02670 [Fibrobacter sp. UWH1]SHL18108.1 hypothetical protein SAMN05720764_10910 [Fibrobacter sp. UWH5]SHL85543.1 hypothetical protein SAMN05720765_1306 [Fibrobacter sp. UWH6]
MQPLKLEDLNAQFDSTVRRYRDGGLIAYRNAHYFMNDMLNCMLQIWHLLLVWSAGLPTHFLEAPV